MPGFAQRRKQVDPRDTLQYHYEYTQAGKNYLLGLNFYGEEARIYTYKVLRRGCVQVGTPFKVEALRDSVSFVNVAGTDYVLFSFLREEADFLSWNLLASSFDGSHMDAVSVQGKALEPQGERFRIEGTSSASMRVNEDALTKYLDSLMASDPRLVVLPDEVYKTDMVVEWWLENNPKALTSAKKVKMASLPADCSAVVAFAGAAGASRSSGAGADADGACYGAVVSNKTKSKSGTYQLASVDMRGYTMIIVRNIRQNTYTLVWAEPTGRTKADRRLVNLYFVDDNTIAMVFYHGSSMLKYRISLGSGQISRS
ncbi:MAG: hypothetical protein ACI3Y4_05375 [Candidatus Cryptobacteroides sp.]